MELNRLCLKTVEMPYAETSPMRCRSWRAIESWPEALLGLIVLIHLRRSVLFGLTQGRVGVIL